MPENGHHGNGQAPSSTLTLTITFDQLTGQMGISGPTQNPVICYGMMECAKNAIAEMAKQNQSRIVPPSMGPRMVI